MRVEPGESGANGTSSSKMLTAPITSTANPAVKAAAKLQGRKGRRDQHAFLVEGPGAVEEGAAQLSELFVTTDALDRYGDVVKTVFEHGAVIRTVTPEVLRVLADTVSPQGLVGVAPITTPVLADVVRGARFVVVLDHVSDPGNAGTIIRTADAAGADLVVLTQGSVDPYNPKSVRSSAGSVFHLPIVTGVTSLELGTITDAGVDLVAVDVHATADTSQVDLSTPVALVFGGEASGLSNEVLEACKLSVRIPIAAPQRPGFEGQAESLNLAAAAAVMAYAVFQAQTG